MLSETITEGLDHYGIGEKVRALRTGKKLGLVQLGEHTGLSAGMLSKIERGQLYPTLPTLLRIALVFGVGLDHFFLTTEQPAFSVVRKADRLRLPDRPDAAEASYYFESLDFPATDREMEAYFAEFPRGAEPSPPHDHAGTELVYVLTGKLAIDLDGTETTLSEGDAIHFDCGATHSYRAVGPTDATAIVVVTGNRTKVQS
jgi:quercetin dioxygenase-like cupin family protein/DNA-binding XRE family transcriptional regulator